MSIKRWDAKRDENEPDIVEALRTVGASVTLLSEKGTPDLLVGYRGRTFLMEVKMPGKDLNRYQSEWWVKWKGERVHIVRDGEQAIAALKPVGGSK